MTPAEGYRNLAAQARTKARVETSPQIRAAWENLAENYLRLADQAERDRRITFANDPNL